MERSGVSGEQELVGGDFSPYTVLHLSNFEPYKWFKMLKFLFILKTVNQIEFLKVQSFWSLQWRPPDSA